MASKVLPWTPYDIPDLSSKSVLITGATSGLGLQTALILALAGARVVLTGRNDSAGAAAITKILGKRPSAQVEYYHMDNLSFKSIEEFSKSFNSKNSSLDILINNAGIYAPERRAVQENGIELTWMSNYLSHFVLTGRLLPSLRRSSAPRVVTVGSLAVILGQIHWSDPSLTKHGAYGHMKAYAQSKVAQLTFAAELRRRSELHNWGILSLAAHPGVADTKMAKELVNRGSWARRQFIRALLSLFMKPVEKGAWPHLAAATKAAEEGFWYYGPGGLLEVGNGVQRARLPRSIEGSGKRLWDLSERMGHFKWSY